MAAMTEFQETVENDARPSIDHDNMGLDIKMKWITSRAIPDNYYYYYYRQHCTQAFDKNSWTP